MTTCHVALPSSHAIDQFADSLLMSGLGVVVVVEGRGGFLRIVTPVSRDTCRGSVGEGRKVRNIDIHPA